MVTNKTRLKLAEIERLVCDITSEQLGIPRDKVSPRSRIIEDLNCDSLDLVELFLEMEDAFDVTISEKAPNAVYKAVFTREAFRLADLSELIYLQQGTGRPSRGRGDHAPDSPRTTRPLPFTQLDGVWNRSSAVERGLFEELDPIGHAEQWRRLSDGMRCVVIPSDTVEIGNDADGQGDERPSHLARVDSFRIDAEPVSTTAYCRFLNSIGDVAPEVLADWFLLDMADDRYEHVLVEKVKAAWRPLAGTERWPMILVSWYGANAYSLWANGRGWHGYRGKRGAEPESFLPSEAQWEYAARGARYQPFPWGVAPPSPDRLRYSQHRRGTRYRADTLPMADVNEPLGLSPFGLHHMAGNVWQWCRDWYDASFYASSEATCSNPVNLSAGQARSERGGSWIGTGALCRSSFRRARSPSARGRCLGFRCISPAAAR